MLAAQAEIRPDPVPGGCVHQWARRVDGNGRPIYCCTRCPAMVDFIAAREEHERLSAQPPQPQPR